MFTVKTITRRALSLLLTLAIVLSVAAVAPLTADALTISADGKSYLFMWGVTTSAAIGYADVLVANADYIQKYETLEYWHSTNHSIAFQDINGDKIDEMFFLTAQNKDIYLNIWTYNGSVSMMMNEYIGSITENDENLIYYVFVRSSNGKVGIVVRSDVIGSDLPNGTSQKAAYFEVNGDTVSLGIYPNSSNSSQINPLFSSKPITIVGEPLNSVGYNEALTALESVAGKTANKPSPETSYTPVTKSTYSANGHTYAVFDIGATWHTAEYQCEQMGGHLATINSKDEEQYIDWLMTSGRKSWYWIGANEEHTGKMQWITGEPWSYTNWDSGEPNNRSDNDGNFEDYLALRRDNQHWNDQLYYGGTNENNWHYEYAGGYICEWDDYNVKYESPTQLAPVEIKSAKTDKSEYTVGETAVITVTATGKPTSAFVVNEKGETYATTTQYTDSGDLRTFVVRWELGAAGTRNVKVRVSGDSGVSDYPLTLNVKEKASTLFLMGEDNYNFVNWDNGFGYSKSAGKISIDRYKEVFGDNEAQTRWENASNWGGSCFGFSSTSVLLNTLKLKPQTYYAETTYKIAAKNAEALIDRYQISWPFVSDTANSNKNNYSGLIAAMRNADGTTNKNGLVIAVSTDNFYHAIVAYDMTEKQGGVYELSIYDCNYPNDKNRKMTITSNTAEKSWSYKSETHGVTCGKKTDDFFQFVAAELVYDAIENTSAAPNNTMDIIVPLNALVTQNGVSVKDIPGAYDAAAPAFAPGAPAPTITNWRVPVGSYDVKLTEQTKNKDIVFFDSNTTFKINTSDTSASVQGKAGNSGYLSILGTNQHTFTLTYRTNETATDPLIVSGTASGNFTATANATGLTLTGNAQLEVKQGGKTEKINVNGTTIVENKTTSTPSSWAKAQVNEAIALGLATADLTNGYQSTTTRIEFCRAAVNFLRKYGYNVDGVTPKMFSDTNDRDIGIAAALGITSGTDTAKNLFSPDSALTREQAATLLRNVLNVLGKNAPMSGVVWTDAKDISSWAKEASDIMYSAKVMGGTSTTALVFSPKTPYTHEQSIITLVNMWKYAKSSVNTETNPKTGGDAEVPISTDPSVPTDVLNKYRYDFITQIKAIAIALEKGTTSEKAANVKKAYSLFQNADKSKMFQGISSSEIHTFKSDGTVEKSISNAGAGIDLFDFYGKTYGYFLNADYPGYKHNISGFQYVGSGGGICFTYKPSNDGVVFQANTDLVMQTYNSADVFPYLWDFYADGSYDVAYGHMEQTTRNNVFEYTERYDKNGKLVSTDKTFRR
jgi:hypothetical protein